MTPRQQQVLVFIASELERTGGVSPSFEEIKKGVGIGQKSSVHRIVNRLVEDGLLTKTGGHHRNLKIADSICPTCGRTGANAGH